MLIGIAAVSLNNVIWKEWKLPWKIPEELSFFKETTMNTTLVMGRKTYDSVWALPWRKTIVISRSNDVSVESIVELSKTEKVFICGWAEIYKLFMPYMKLFVLSRVQMNIDDGDTFLPELEGFYKAHAESNQGKFNVEFYTKRLD